MKGRSIVAKRLREARLRVGISQKRLGILAGIDEFSSSSRINQYERGKHTPDFVTVERLAKVLEVPAPYLFCKDNELAEWILMFTRLSVTQREAILGHANTGRNP
jgi:transcriptional regulator with XRE-family HTH domain